MKVYSHKKCGFTLIEAVVSMAVIGITGTLLFGLCKNSYIVSTKGELTQKSALFAQQVFEDFKSVDTKTQIEDDDIYVTLSDNTKIDLKKSGDIYSAENLDILKNRCKADISIKKTTVQDSRGKESGLGISEKDPIEDHKDDYIVIRDVDIPSSEKEVNVVSRIITEDDKRYKIVEVNGEIVGKSEYERLVDKKKPFLVYLNFTGTSSVKLNLKNNVSKSMLNVCINNKNNQDIEMPEDTSYCRIYKNRSKNDKLSYDLYDVTIKVVRASDNAEIIDQTERLNLSF